MFAHIDVPFRMGGVLCKLIVVKLFFVVVWVKYSLKSFAVVVWFSCSTLKEFDISLYFGLSSTLIILLIQAAFNIF